MLSLSNSASSLVWAHDLCKTDQAHQYRVWWSRCFGKSLIILLYLVSECLGLIPTENYESNEKSICPNPFLFQSEDERCAHCIIVMNFTQMTINIWSLHTSPSRALKRLSPVFIMSHYSLIDFKCHFVVSFCKHYTT